MKTVLSHALELNALNLHRQKNDYILIQNLSYLLLYLNDLNLRNKKNLNCNKACDYGFKEVKIIIQSKTKYLQYSMISRFKQQNFINFLNVSEALR